VWSGERKPRELGPQPGVGPGMNSVGNEKEEEKGASLKKSGTPGRRGGP